MAETPWLESRDVKELSAEPFEILAKFKYDNLIKFSNIFWRKCEIGLCKLETYNQNASGERKKLNSGQNDVKSAASFCHQVAS